MSGETLRVALSTLCVCALALGGCTAPKDEGATNPAGTAQPATTIRVFADNADPRSYEVGASTYALEDEMQDLQFLQVGPETQSQAAPLRCSGATRNLVIIVYGTNEERVDSTHKAISCDGKTWGVGILNRRTWIYSP